MVDDVARYARVSAALAALAELSVGPDGAGLARVLAGDDVVLARMRAAAAALRAAGMTVALRGAEADLLRAAVGWQRYSRGPVTPLHGACAADVSRGLLRMWARTRRPSDRPRVRLRQARIGLSGRVRTRCAALRAELRAGVGGVALRQCVDFRERAERRLNQVAREVAAEVDWELTPAAPGDPPGVDLPPYPVAGLENRLTVLLGAGFGAGAAVTLGRVWTEFLPGRSALVAAVSVAAGLLLGGWVARTRRLLHERAVLDRWVCEGVAALRSALDEYVAARVVAADSATAAASIGHTAITGRVHPGVNLHPA